MQPQKINFCNHEPRRIQLIKQINMPLENYEVLQKIGYGKYSSVYKVKRLNDQRYLALKKISLDKMTPKEKQNSLNEVKLLNSIQHPNVISLIEVFFDNFINSLCLVMELAEEGDLHDKVIHRQDKQIHFKEEQIWNILEQISSGLEFLHSHNVLHRDIKTKNILMFKEGIAKIGDLNVSTITDGLSHTRTGTLNYASPEVLMGKPYNSKTDIWSLGCLIYELICLHKPFQGENIEDIYKKIYRGQYTKMREDYSIQLRDLVSFMIQLNPKVRPSAQTIHKIVLKSKRASIMSITGNRQKSFTPMGLDNTDLAIEGWQNDNSKKNLKKIGGLESILDQKKWVSVRKQRPRQLCPIPSTIKIIKTKDTFSIGITKSNTKTGQSRQSNRLFSEDNQQSLINIEKSKQTHIQSIKQPALCSMNHKGGLKRMNQLRRLTIKRRNTQL